MYRVINIDETGIIFSSDQQASNIFGYDRKDIVGQHISLFMAEEGRSRDSHGIGLRIQASQFINTPARIVRGRRKDGSTFALEILVCNTQTDATTTLIAILRDVTKPIEAEAMLRESAARFCDLFDKSELGIHIGNLKGGRVYVNQACTVLFGYSSSEDLLKARRGSLVAKNDQKRILEINDGLYAGEIRSTTYEFEGVRKDGSRIPIQAFAQRIIWEGKHAIQRTFVDLSDRERTERRLKESQESLAEAQRIGNMGSWEWNIVTNNLSWSDQIYRIFGLAPQEFGPSYPAFLERVHPEDRAYVEESVRRAVENQAPYDINHRIVLPNGQVRCLRERGEVEYDAGGQPLKMLGTVQDVTEQKAAEGALKKSRAMLSGILTIAEEAIILADDDLRVILFSRGAQRVFGYEDQEAIGLHIERLIPERFVSAHRHHVRDFADGSETSVRMGSRPQLLGLRKNGEEFPAAISLSKFPTGNGYLYSLILRDIGPEIAARDELLTAKLTAETANRAKSSFLANMSHELRTPLNAIIGFSETVHRQTFGPVGSQKYVEYMGGINQAGKHLLKIINDILDLSKIEAGKLDLRESIINVPETVSSCLLLVKERAHTGGVTLHANVPDGLPPLFADERKLKQILINLLSNAIKFTPRDGEVTIKAWSRRNTGYVFQITDTGIGIALENIPAVLTPFKQVDSELNRSFEGTGLGLPLTKSLTELHSGSFDLQSEVGVGTTVTVRFPSERIVLHKATGT